MSKVVEVRSGMGDWLRQLSAVGVVRADAHKFGEDREWVVRLADQIDVEILNVLIRAPDEHYEREVDVALTIHDTRVVAWSALLYWGELLYSPGDSNWCRYLGYWPKSEAVIQPIEDARTLSAESLAYLTTCLSGSRYKKTGGWSLFLSYHLSETGEARYSGCGDHATVLPPLDVTSDLEHERWLGASSRYSLPQVAQASRQAVLGEFLEAVAE